MKNAVLLSQADRYKVLSVSNPVKEPAVPAIAARSTARSAVLDGSRSTDKNLIHFKCDWPVMYVDHVCRPQTPRR